VKIQEFVIQLVVFILLGLFIYGFTKLTRFSYNGFHIEFPGKSLTASMLSILFGIGLVVLIFLAIGSSGGQEIDDSKIRYLFSSVLSQTLAALIMFGPAMLTLRSRKESWESTGISRHNLGKSILLGILLDVITVALSLIDYNSISTRITTVPLSQFLWGFVHFGIVGFVEEFTFRGYLQSRFCGLLGTIKGWLLASILMASVHIFQRILIMGLSTGEALFSTLALIPISLLMGYVFIRTENVAAPAIFHTFTDWNGILFLKEKSVKI